MEKDNITENSSFVNRRERRAGEEQGIKKKKIFLRERKKEQGIVGKTIVPEREGGIQKNDEDSERERVRKRTRRRKVVSVFGIVVLIGVLGALSVVGVENFLDILSKEDDVVQEEKFVPTVEIYDENTGKSSNNSLAEISSRMIEYVGQIEADLKDLGYKISRVVLPIGKAREIDIYLEGRSAYYKTSVDRETAVTAEDIGRMTKYLEGNGISSEYVDVRVEGKAYYK